MEYKNINAEKVLVLILIACMFVESIAAMPLSEEGSTKKPRNTKSPHHRGRGHNHAKKNLMHFSDEYDEFSKDSWRNPCVADDYRPAPYTEANFNSSHEAVRLSVLTINSSLAGLHAINSSAIVGWNFKTDNFTFLPEHPMGMAYNWHRHVQIYAASFHIAYERQKILDNNNNDNKISNELKQMYDHARTLLCEIERFVNATSNSTEIFKDGWYGKKFLKNNVTLKEKTLINNIFVKARFQSYIKKLYKRIKHFNHEKNVIHLEQISQSNLQPNRNRKSAKRPNNLRRRWKTTTAIGEQNTTEKTFIVRTPTMKMRKNKKGTKLPGQKRKHKINKSLN